jgi:hypothetical protein
LLFEFAYINHATGNTNSSHFCRSHGSNMCTAHEICSRCFRIGSCHRADPTTGSTWSNWDCHCTSAIR